MAIVAQRLWVAVCGALKQLSVLQHHYNLQMHAARYLPQNRASESTKGLKLCSLNLAKCLKPTVIPSVFGRHLCTFAAIANIDI